MQRRDMFREIRWLFFDLSVLINESGTEREARRAIADAFARRGRSVDQGQVERAWMQSIAGPKPLPPLEGTIRLLAADGATARAVLAEVTQRTRNADMLATGLHLALNALRARFRLGVVAPYHSPFDPAGTRARLERFHLSFPVSALCDELDLSHRLGPSGSVDPALFTWALHHACCLPNQAAYVSDRVALGLAPAKLAGMTTIWLRQSNYRLRYPRCAAETPDLTCSSLQELARTLTQAPAGER